MNIYQKCIEESIIFPKEYNRKNYFTTNKNSNQDNWWKCSDVKAQYGVNYIQDEGVKKTLPISFARVISTNVGSSPENCLGFSFNIFVRLAKNLNAIPGAISNY